MHSHAMIIIVQQKLSTGHNRGIPEERMQKNNRTSQVPLSALPTPEEAVRAYEQTGGQLTLFPKFGSDPLGGHSKMLETKDS